MQHIGKLLSFCLALTGAATTASAAEGYMFCVATPRDSAVANSNDDTVAHLRTERLAQCLQGSSDSRKLEVCRAEVEKRLPRNLQNGTALFTDHFLARESDRTAAERQFQIYISRNYPDTNYTPRCKWSRTRLDSEAARGSEIVQKRKNQQSVEYIDAVFSAEQYANYSPQDEKFRDRYTDDFRDDQWKLYKAVMVDNRLLYNDTQTFSKVKFYYRESVKYSPLLGYSANSGIIEWRCNNETLTLHVTCQIRGKDGSDDVKYVCANGQTVSFPGIDLYAEPGQTAVSDRISVCEGDSKRPGLRRIEAKVTAQKVQ